MVLGLKGVENLIFVDEIDDECVSREELSNRTAMIINWRINLLENNNPRVQRMFLITDKSRHEYLKKVNKKTGSRINRKIHIIKKTNKRVSMLPQASLLT
ncbi:MAG: hypothetical protein GY915_01725, partial [bacterium]|nr:hypothetical protein [bacterium]